MIKDLREAYLEICDGNNGEPCDGDPSVGIPACPYFDPEWKGGCILKNSKYDANGLNALAAEVHEVAVAHGWWASSPSFPAVIALCHSELSEALEAYRNGEDLDVINYTFEGCGDVTKDECAGCFGGAPVELADCIIRILDYCGHAGIDIDAAIREKIRHNKTRPYRHGGKVV